jgi:hypothetical protein
MANPETCCRGIKITVPAPSKEDKNRTVERSVSAHVELLEHGERAVEAVLKHYDPKNATYAQVVFLADSDSKRAVNALEKAFAAGNERVRRQPSYLFECRSEEVTKFLLEVATAETGSKEWSWGGSRQALQALDNRLGPQHKDYADNLVYELGARLVTRRNRYRMRSNESIWGAFRTAFFLGRIGDKKAIPVLRRAAKNKNLLLRWYATAALNLIDIQNQPGEKQPSLIKEWLKHCFSSPEEHFMARERLISYLNSLLNPKERREFYSRLLLQLKDPWMRAEAECYSK